MESVLSKYHQKKYNGIFISKLPNLRNVEKKHTTIQELAKVRVDIIVSKHSFAFVRIPYDRIVSYYYYYSKQRNLKTFEDFVLKYVRDKEKLSHHDFWYKQTPWLCDMNGNIAVDFIGKFEKLERDFNEITKKVIGKPLYNELPHLKKSEKKKPYESYYTDKLRDIVYQECKEDFDNFNYDK